MEDQNKEKKEDSVSIAETLLVGIPMFGIMAALIAVLYIVMSALYAWVLTIVWQWFIVSQFGANPITLKQALGVTLIAGFLIGRHKTDREDFKNKSKSQKIGEVFEGVLWPFVFLGGAWVLKTFLLQ